MITDIISIVVTLLGIVLAWFIYCKEKNDHDKRKLAKEVIAFYYIEKVAIRKIAELTNKNPRTIQNEIRDEAVKEEGNPEQYRPKLSDTTARKFL